MLADCAKHRFSLTREEAEPDQDVKSTDAFVLSLLFLAQVAATARKTRRMPELCLADLRPIASFAARQMRGGEG